MDPIVELGSDTGVLGLVLSKTLDYVQALPDLSAHPAAPTPAGFADRFPLPVQGVGSRSSVETLWNLCRQHGANTASPRFFDFVIGGVTPAALAADWITSTFDQNAAGRVTGDLATEIELVVIGWFTSLLGLASHWHGVMVPSCTYANMAGLAAARQWCGEHAGVDVTEDGTSALPPITVVGTAYAHPSIEKALQLLGIGRRALIRISLTSAKGLDQARAALDGPGAGIVVASAGEVNGGRFDSLPALADLADETGAWLHVDAAFGLSAAFDPALRNLLDGIDRARSIATDGHKWLNLPYDCGLVLLANRDLARRTFEMPAAPYLRDLVDPQKPGLASLGPDASRRARAFPAFAALLAYGSAGMRDMIRRQLAAAATLSRRLEESPHFEVMVEPTLPILTFRVWQQGVDPEVVDVLNEAFAAKINSDGRFAVGTTVEREKRCLRVALLNWSVTEAVVEEFWGVLLAAALEVTDGVAKQ